jgi:UDP-glucuronate 4-epimerase
MQRDFTYVDDIVEGVIRVNDRPPPPTRRTTPSRPTRPPAARPTGCSTSATTTRCPAGLHRLHRGCLGKKAEKRLLPLQDGDVPATYANTDALRDWVGFVPGTSVKDGIARFVAWYRDYYKV